jgi:hypothetical protein
VEQRVKVMDTLDKKMQTILDREDLSADERLKLYEQSFRPRPVAVAPEPVKQDLIDDEQKNNEGQGTTLVEKSEEQFRH